MKIAVRTKLGVYKVLYITIAWMLVSLAIHYFDYFSFLAISENQEIYFDRLMGAVLNTLSALLAGIIGGSAIVFPLTAR